MSTNSKWVTVQFQVTTGIVTKGQLSGSLLSGNYKMKHKVKSLEQRKKWAQYGNWVIAVDGNCRRTKWLLYDKLSLTHLFFYNCSLKLLWSIFWKSSDLWAPTCATCVGDKAHFWYFAHLDRQFHRNLGWTTYLLISLILSIVRTVAMWGGLGVHGKNALHHLNLSKMFAGKHVF